MDEWNLILSKAALRLYDRLTTFPIERTTLTDLAGLCRLSPWKTKQAIAELEHHGFLSVIPG